MSENEKPRLCEVLGVEVNQEFVVDTDEYRGYPTRINANGDREARRGDVWEITAWEHQLIEAINHPEVVKIMQRWTTEDVKTAEAIRLIWPNSTEVEREADDAISVWTGYGYSVELDGCGDIFNSLKRGGIVDLNEILKSGGDSRG